MINFFVGLAVGVLIIGIQMTLHKLMLLRVERLIRLEVSRLATRNGLR